MSLTFDINSLTILVLLRGYPVSLRYPVLPVPSDGIFLGTVCSNVVTYFWQKYAWQGPHGYKA